MRSPDSVAWSATIALVVLGIAAILGSMPGARVEHGAFREPCRHVKEGAAQLGNAFLVIAHRGYSSVAPENTLAAVEEAFAAGADMVEVDLHFTRDGVPVVIHDETLERTTTGQGLVVDKSLAELRVLDAGAWKHARYAGQRVPTLEEILTTVTGRGRVLLDLKVDGLGLAVAGVVRRLGVAPSMLAIGTQTPAQTADFVRQVPGAQVLHNFEVPADWGPDLFAHDRARGIGGLELGANWSRDFVAAAHAQRLSVYVYTINDEPTMRALVEMGVDGIETDEPARLAQLLARTGWRHECAKR